MTMTTPQLAVVPAPIEAVLEPVTSARAASRPRPGLARLWPDSAAAVVGAVLGHALAPGARPATIAVVPLVWLALVACSGGYADVPGTAPGLRVRAIGRAAAGIGLIAWGLAATAPALLVTRPVADLAGVGRTVLVLAVLLAALTLAFRFVARRTASYAPVPVVVAGDPAGVREVLDEIERAGRKGAAGFVPTGVCVPADADLAGCDVRLWSGLDLLHDAVADGDARAVIMVPGPHADHRVLRRIGTRLQDDGVGLLVGSGLRDVATGRLDLGAAGGLGLLHVRPAPLRGPRRWMKAAAERAAAAVLLVLAAPMLLAIALAVRLDSPGAAIFTQVRVGRDGCHFTVLKFRTMTTDAPRLVDTLSADNESDRTGVLFKIRQDPRITRVGAVLRRYSLDELPQLLNVVRGEMSLVGPRPALPSEVAAYAPDMRRRLVVRPGLTGLWQVSGRSDLTWDETVRLDLQYVDNWSLSLDLAIALRTAGAVLSHRGAY